MSEENEVELNEVDSKQKNYLGTIGMSLGILSVTICCSFGIIFGAGGLTCSLLALKKYSPETDATQRTMAWCGIACSGIGILLGIAAFVAFLSLCAVWIKNGGFYL